MIITLLIQNFATSKKDSSTKFAGIAKTAISTISGNKEIDL